MRTEFLQGLTSELSKNPIHFAGKNAQRMKCSCFPACGEAIERGRPDHHRVRAERNGLHHVAAASKPTIHNHNQSVVDGVRDLG